MAFRVIVAGSRNFDDYELLSDTSDKLLQNKGKDVVIVSGTARGADTLGEQYAAERGFQISRFPADWDRFGKSAGYRRNVQMAENADALVAFWDGVSRGTGHMINIAKEKNLLVRIKYYKKEEGPIMDYWSKREENKVKAQEHTAFVAKKHRQKIQGSVANTRIYSPDSVFDGPEEIGMPTICFLNIDSVSAILKVAENGRGGKVAVLNYASYKNPGGKFIEGSSAQEESLCHESFLYNVLREFSGYYAENKKNLNRSLYTNRALYTEEVLFERGERRGECDVITCAAPNYSAAKKYQNVPRDENSEALRERIEFVRAIAEENGVNTLILGAFGCGVFGQDPEEVARIMLEEVFFETSISNIVYAVPGKDKNVLAFKMAVEKELAARKDG